VERREKPRFPADLVARVTDLEGTSEAFAGSVVDISESGACVLLSMHLMAGSTVKLELDDAVLYGHVTYAFGADSKFRTGIAVESVLLGTSDLSKILQALLDASPRPALRHTTP
jgi:hypothetical protein